MKNSFSILILILGSVCFGGCLNRTFSQQKAISSSNSIDSSILQVDSINLLSNHFTVLYKDDYMLYVICNIDTVNKVDCNNGFEFDDFNQDGFKDIIIPYMTNIPGIQNVLQFNPLLKRFILIDNLSNYPLPIRISNNYFYSYRRAGCADNYWVSYLFKIEDFRTICLGEIWGQGCESNSMKIEIFKISSADCESKQLIKTLPLDTIYKFQDTKWGFIKSYWTKNFSEFQ